MSIKYVTTVPIRLGDQKYSAGADVTAVLANGSGWQTSRLMREGYIAAAPSEPSVDSILEDITTTASSGTTETLDLSEASVFDVTLDDNCTFTFSGETSGSANSFTLILRQDATGSRTVTWPASVDWPAATAPTLTTDANGVDVLTFLTVDDGTTWLGFTAGQAMG